MKILVVGGGGREHALAWRLARDPERPEILCAPGNTGTAQVGRNVAVDAADVPGLVALARAERPDLTVIGPEAPLCAGLADALLAEGFAVFGPTRDGARLEGSKVFCKDVLRAADVPTAEAERFTDAAAAKACARARGGAVVVKADGLAAGKGVTVCTAVAEAEAAIDDALVKGVFGDAGREVLIEERLVGEEVSILGLVDGERVVLLASAQDHKRVFDDDRGPNTGGMGAYSPAPVIADADLPAIREMVFERTLAELKRRGIAYRGVLYAGLMMTDGGSKVLEFNCRFGDPETQAILPRWAGSVSQALLACAQGRLDPGMVTWHPGACVCVVLAAGGYPGPYAKGKAIEGIEAAGALEDVAVFHAGTAVRDGRVVTAGGRVLGVTACGEDIRAAVSRAYEAVGRIRFEGMHCRRDIAARALRRM
ncbi:MAG: phosphoribosylamine--glycine ligase [Verrucomicrobia bacterium]|nr:phosphoribosylamine--glycine ligase [Verrucomicrobiota bacterium]